MERREEGDMTFYVASYFGRRFQGRDKWIYVGTIKSEGSSQDTNVEFVFEG